ncbi:hypothetical protein ABIE78_003433 [Sinorhizobium fredii]|uniref:Uncharacterized protein n=1 Tax=Sinorhizobium fredii (strain USDA 257) TaxID=1185652 RepID=I3X4G8_SINF2|nr:hypothetical protein USDA257_c21920 [Sinorhizobium fredii USDA 257]
MPAQQAGYLCAGYRNEGSLLRETLRLQSDKVARDGIVELFASDGGANIMLHPAAKGQRDGQSVIKLVFDVADVEAFCRRSAENGLEFGPIHARTAISSPIRKTPAKTPYRSTAELFGTRTENFDYAHVSPNRSRFKDGNMQQSNVHSDLCVSEKSLGAVGEALTIIGS